MEIEIALKRESLLSQSSQPQKYDNLQYPPNCRKEDGGLHWWAVKMQIYGPEPIDYPTWCKMYPNHTGNPWGGLRDSEVGLFDPSLYLYSETLSGIQTNGVQPSYAI